MSAWNFLLLSLFVPFTSQDPESEISRLFEKIGVNEHLREVNEWIYHKCWNASQKLYSIPTVELFHTEDKVENCFRDFVNFTELESEISAAKPTGNLDEAFLKYCRRVPTLHNCFLNATSPLELCLKKSEIVALTNIQNIFYAFFDFICQKGGNYIALFIAEKGEKCLQEKTEAVQSCQPASPRNNAKLETYNLFSFLKLGMLECQELFEYEVCVVQKLRGCKDPFTANMVEAAFDSVNNRTTCNIPSLKARSGASSPWRFTLNLFPAFLVKLYT